MEAVVVAQICIRYIVRNAFIKKVMRRVDTLGNQL